MRDTGIGMASGAAQAKPGLGTGIVEALSRQLGATVLHEPANPGTLISITRG